ncbi:DUF1178 family protein [Caldimonas brevitalea]|uniref:DUF1178 domain-containing protein n=1 Tax=Caldimonas brevitalea TaxID=413882 RepID=A0A0G3BKC2_9BURK|nr:DUF1178 family protein [Caldimonas brevitalea]AKJ28443.1 hypothetical protein AAW51_1752 [Caldimonas brevitalea]
MKVWNLQCRHEHGFEGWFASEDDYRSQLERGLLVCPYCGDGEITRMPSAPRLNLSHAKAPPAAQACNNTTPPGPANEMAPQQPPTPQALQALFLRAVRHVIANTEDVGERFPEEARRIHHGETEARAIRGHATREETEALIDEGIDVVPLPLPDALKGPLQ